MFIICTCFAVSLLLCTFILNSIIVSFVACVWYQDCQPWWLRWETIGITINAKSEDRNILTRIFSHIYYCSSKHIVLYQWMQCCNMIRFYLFLCLWVLVVLLTKIQFENCEYFLIHNDNCSQKICIEMNQLKL